MDPLNRTFIASGAAALALACGTDDGSGGSSGPGGNEPVPGIVGANDPPPMPTAADDPNATQGGFQVDVGNACSGEDANVLFIVDRSGSMNCNLPPITDSIACEQDPVQADTGQPRKWDVITNTLSNTLDTLIPEAGGIAVHAGLNYFNRDDICGVLSAPVVPVNVAETGHLDMIRSALFSEVPKGGTPIVGALVTAYKHLHQEVPFVGLGNVVLITDGADSCQGSYEATYPDPKPTVPFLQHLIDAEMPKAQRAGIRTFVIGAPGSEGARNILSRIAFAGGTAPEGCDQGSIPTEGNCHYDMTQGNFEEQLTAALDEITNIVTCRVQ